MADIVAMVVFWVVFANPVNWSLTASIVLQGIILHAIQ